MNRVECTRCGHLEEVHTHFNSSTHCALRLCRCGRFRGPSLLKRWLTWRKR